MTTTVTHNETKLNLVDIATLAPGDVFASQGSTFMLLVTPNPAASVGGQAVNLDTKAQVAVNPPLLVQVLDASIVLTDHAAPVPAPAPVVSTPAPAAT